MRLRCIISGAAREEGRTWNGSKGFLRVHQKVKKSQRAGLLLYMLSSTRSSPSLRSARWRDHMRPAEGGGGRAQHSGFPRQCLILPPPPFSLHVKVP